MVAPHPYTRETTAGDYVIFPNHAEQILSNCIHIIGASLLAWCIARRSECDLFTRQGRASVTWTRLCVMLLFWDSWFFVAISGVLVNGVGLSYSAVVCSLGIYACIIFYAFSKALIYIFLVERVWIVWSAGNSLTRRQSKLYRICAFVIVGYTGVFILMIVGRVTFFKRDGTCVIGLEHFASIPLLTYDLFVNVFLTSLFVWPLYRDNLRNPRLKSVAWRTLFAAGAALTTSSVNIAILTALHGQQLGWVCLSSCATDVTLNALVLYWVTPGGQRPIRNSQGSPHPNLSLSFVRDPSVPRKSPVSPARPLNKMASTFFARDGQLGPLTSSTSYAPIQAPASSLAAHPGMHTNERRRACRCHNDAESSPVSAFDHHEDKLEHTISFSQSQSHASFASCPVTVHSTHSLGTEELHGESVQSKHPRIMRVVGKAFGMSWRETRQPSTSGPKQTARSMGGTYAAERHIATERTVSTTDCGDDTGHYPEHIDFLGLPVDDIENAEGGMVGDEGPHHPQAERTRPS